MKRILISLDSEGKTRSHHTNATHIRYQLITPTHWMRISMQNGQFENAFGGTYTRSGIKMIFHIDYASFPIVGFTAELTERFEGNKLTLSGPIKDAGGKQVNNIVDVFERVNTTAAKSLAKMK